MTLNTTVRALALFALAACAKQNAPPAAPANAPLTTDCEIGGMRIVSHLNGRVSIDGNSTCVISNDAKNGKGDLNLISGNFSAQSVGAIAVQDNEFVFTEKKSGNALAVTPLDGMHFLVSAVPTP